MSWRNFPVPIVLLLSLRNRLKIEVGQVLSVVSWVQRGEVEELSEICRDRRPVQLSTHTQLN